MADKKRKAVVTGGAGFIGSNLVRALIDAGWETHIIDKNPAFRRDSLPREAALHEFNVLETEKTAEVFAGADVVFHTAAMPRVSYSIDNPVETTDENITGTVSVLAAAVKAKVHRVVYSSSGSSYGNQDVLPLVETMPANPVHPYGVQKYAGELFMNIWPNIYGIETVSLRYFNVYGLGLDPNGAYALAVGRFITARRNNEPITIYGDGTVTRDFTHVSDVVNANMLAATSTKVGKGDVINIGAGRNVTIRFLADLFGGEIVYAPPRIEAHDSLADNTKARELLGWIPQVRLEDGIASLKKEMGVE
jgi:UDP-glucose 4-epimerase